jgi:diketogulonate reductase-like aldo/keto reductase
MENLKGKDQPYLTLNDGNRMPQVGLGLFLSKDPEELEKVVIAAIMEEGYRHLDGAWIYGNEAVVGKALKHCFENGIKREDLFITTKNIPSQNHRVEESLKESLTWLGLDYVDLFLVHSVAPNIDYQTHTISGPPLHQVWAEFERMKEIGLTKSIGVSNCPVAVYLQMLTFAKVKPAVNQIEVHTYFQQTDAVKFFQKMGMHVTCYAPIGASGFVAKKNDHKSYNAFEDPLVVELSQKYNRTPAQIILNWHLHRGTNPIPKTIKVSRLAENLNCYDFKMTEEEYQRYEELDRNARFFDPRYIPGYGNTPYYQ